MTCIYLFSESLSLFLAIIYMSNPTCIQISHAFAALMFLEIRINSSEFIQISSPMCYPLNQNLIEQADHCDCVLIDHIGAQIVVLSNVHNKNVTRYSSQVLFSSLDSILGSRLTCGNLDLKSNKWGLKQRSKDFEVR